GGEARRAAGDGLVDLLALQLIGEGREIEREAAAIPGAADAELVVLDLLGIDDGRDPVIGGPGRACVRGGVLAGAGFETLRVRIIEEEIVGRAPFEADFR